MTTPACPYCGESAEIVEAEAVGIHGFGTRVWYCKHDHAWSAIHSNSPTNKPVSRLSKASEHVARREAVARFTKLYKTWGADRMAAYQWLASLMHIELGECDFNKFSRRQCIDANNIVSEFIPNFTNT